MFHVKHYSINSAFLFFHTLYVVFPILRICDKIGVLRTKNTGIILSLFMRRRESQDKGSIYKWEKLLQ